MDDPDARSPKEAEELTSRAPEEADLVELCRELNRLEARYIVIGGFAIIYAGLPRMTGRILSALEVLPDKAASELEAGEIEKYTVVRVADEIVVDLLVSASGIDYRAAESEILYQDIRGVRIPFASPRLLYRMKAVTRRAKDEGDVMFLRQYFRQSGEEPPSL